MALEKPGILREFFSATLLPPLPFSALMLFFGRQEGHLACKKTESWGAGVVICLERGADLHMVPLMPLPLTVCCSSKIQIGFTFLVSAHQGSTGQRAVKRVCVCGHPVYGFFCYFVATLFMGSVFLLFEVVC